MDNLEQRMLEQEAAISSLESRHAYSLHCAQLETQLVHLHLTELAAVFNALAAVNLQAHTEVHIMLTFPLGPGVPFYRCHTPSQPHRVSTLMCHIKHNDIGNTVTQEPFFIYIN